MRITPSPEIEPNQADNIYQAQSRQSDISAEALQAGSESATAAFIIAMVVLEAINFTHPLPGAWQALNCIAHIPISGVSLWIAFEAGAQVQQSRSK